MGSVEDKLKEMGLSLPSSPAPLANYVPVVRTEAGLVYTSGQGPRRPDSSFITGKLGADISVEEGYEAARLTALGLLSTLKGEIGDLDRVARVVKLLCMVNCTLEFDQHPLVANGASDLLVELFGDRGRHARSAIGVGSLPGNICVEIEMIAEVSS